MLINMENRMKKALLFTSCLILGLGMTTVNAQSQTEAPSAAAPTANMTNNNMSNNKMMMMPKHHRHHSCMKIASACEEAGYRLSKHMPGKKIWKDCVTPILKGKTISGVTVNASDVKACKEHAAVWKMKHGMHHHMMKEKMMTTTPATQTESPSSSSQ